VPTAEENEKLLSTVNPRLQEGSAL